MDEKAHEQVLNGTPTITDGQDVILVQSADPLFGISMRFLLPFPSYFY